MKNTRRLTLKYRFLLALCRLFKLQRVMELPPKKAKKLFAKVYKGVQIPKLNDEQIITEVEFVMESTCLFYRHKTKCSRICIYLIGGGMLKYPKPSQAREVLKLSKITGVDFVLIIR